MIDPNWCRENPEEAAKQMELLTEQNDKLKDWQQEMVAKAADKSLAGYRELAERLATTEADRDVWRAQADADAHMASVYREEVERQRQEVQRLRGEASRLAQRAEDALADRGRAVMQARRDWAAQGAEAVKLHHAREVIEEFRKACETNGNTGECFGLAVSGPARCSDVAACLRACRAVFTEALRIIDWRIGQEDAQHLADLLTGVDVAGRIRAAAVRDAIEATRDSMMPGGERWLCHVDRLNAYADELEAGPATPKGGARTTTGGTGKRFVMKWRKYPTTLPHPDDQGSD